MINDSLSNIVKSFAWSPSASSLLRIKHKFLIFIFIIFSFSNCKKNKDISTDKVSENFSTSILSKNVLIRTNSACIPNKNPLNNPKGMAVNYYSRTEYTYKYEDPKYGNLIIADTCNNLVKEIDFRTKKVINTWNGFKQPYAVAVDRNNGNIFIADTGNNLIKVIYNQSTTPILYVKEKFSNPTGIAIDNDSNVYVANSGNMLLNKITPGKIISSVGFISNSSFQFSSQNTFVDKIHNNFNSKILLSILDLNYPDFPDFNEETSIPTYTFPMYLGVSVNNDGILYVADNQTNNIYKLNKNGSISIIKRKNIITGISINFGGQILYTSISHDKSIGWISLLNDNESKPTSYNISSSSIYPLVGVESSVNSDTIQFVLDSKLNVIYSIPVTSLKKMPDNIFYPIL